MRPGDVVRIHVDYSPLDGTSWFQDRVGMIMGPHRFSEPGGRVVDILVDGSIATVHMSWLSLCQRPCPMGTMA